MCNDKDPMYAISFTIILDKSWIIVSETTRKPCYQPVEDCTCWNVFGSFNNLNIIQFTIKTTTNKDFDAAHRVVLYGISDKMPTLVQNRKYGAINIADPTKICYYGVKVLSDHIGYKTKKKLTSNS